MTDIWDDLFGGFESLQKRIERMMENFSDPGVRTYGYTMYKGPDGVPHVHEFGSGIGDAQVPDGVREPLTDVCVDGNIVRIVVELPGVTKEDIKLEGTETSMTVTVEAEKRKFGKTIPLPCNVDPNSAKAEYNNGILEITVESKNKIPKAKNIPIS